MIKSQLIANLAIRMPNLSEKTVAESVNHILDLMGTSLYDDQRIEIRGFGSFSLRHRPSRTAHNPKTGEKVNTEEKYTPHFKPGKELRERVDESRHKVKLRMAVKAKK